MESSPHKAKCPLAPLAWLTVEVCLDSAFVSNTYQVVINMPIIIMTVVLAPSALSITD